MNKHSQNVETFADGDSKWHVFQRLQSSTRASCWDHLNQFWAQPPVFAAKIGTEWYLNGTWMVPENVHSIHNYQIVAYWKCHKRGYLIFSHTQVSYCCFVVTVIPTRSISTSYSHYVKLCSPEITFPWNPINKVLVQSHETPISPPLNPLKSGFPMFNSPFSSPPSSQLWVPKHRWPATLLPMPAATPEDLPIEPLVVTGCACGNSPSIQWTYRLWMAMMGISWYIIKIYPNMGLKQHK